MTQNSNGNGPHSARGNESGLPASDLIAAAPFLRAPFPADTVGFQARRLSPTSQWATVFATISVWDVEERLDLVVGPTNWEVSEPAVFDQAHVTRTLTVFGERRGCIGDGASRLIQASNAEKRCAIHFGVGRYLKLMRPRRMELGAGENRLPVTQKGSPYIPDQILGRVQRAYEQELRRLAASFGAPFERASSTTPGEPSQAAAPNATVADPEPPRPNGHGAKVKSAAAERGLYVGQLANLILETAGEPARSPERAAAVLDRLLAAMPENVAEGVLARLAFDAGDGRPAHESDARASASARADGGAGTGASDGGTVTVDFAAIGPADDRQAA
jgi:hypothetical protein